MAGITFGHHGGRLKGRVGDLGHRQLLVIGFLSRDDWSIRRQHEMDARVRHQVGLELGHIHVQGTVEAQRGCQGRDDLSNETVKVGVGRALDVKRATADVVHGLVVEHNGNVGVLQERVGGQHRVVRLNHRGRNLGRGIDGESEFGFFAVVDGQALQQERAETGAGAAANSIEDKEALEPSAVVGQLADAVQDEVDNLLANGVVATGKIVGGILLSGDELLGVEQLTVGAGADLVDDGRLQVNEDGTGHMLAGTSLGEEGVEGIIATSNSLVGGHLAIGLDAVLQAVELPAGVTGLDTGLANVDADDFPHDER
mmetsp:Transcript_4124/g.11639  ORF Transcript_4124/g.11639 Transcript_4124/m.11639 type:complete len:313 (+) Transcript_4124:715-1653(+)